MDLDKLMNKSFTRAFDPSKTIPEEHFSSCKVSAVHAASVNIKPNHFYILATAEGKERLVANLGERSRTTARRS